jgi:hypothetical protein
VSAAHGRRARPKQFDSIFRRRLNRPASRSGDNARQRIVMEHRMERRQHKRARTLKSAHILFNQHRSVIDCTVRNVSAVGACLNVESALGIPERFDVMFDADKTVRPCRLIWHREKQVGVEFT